MFLNELKEIKAKHKVMEYSRIFVKNNEGWQWVMVTLLFFFVIPNQLKYKKCLKHYSNVPLIKIVHCPFLIY